MEDKETLLSTYDLRMRGGEGRWGAAGGRVWWSWWSWWW